MHLEAGLEHYPPPEDWSRVGSFFFFISIDADSTARTGRTAGQAGQGTARKTRICFGYSFVYWSGDSCAACHLSEPWYRTSHEIAREPSWHACNSPSRVMEHV